ncbi:MAG: YIP1 family protein [Gemmatimonadetes bacterium]|nr:YIP1 family protein [Gemmatimonadota bacterium]
MNQPLESTVESTVASTAPILPLRIVQTFTSPGELFARLRETPVWIDAMVALIALGVLFQFVQPESLQVAAIEAFAPEGVDPEELVRSPSLVSTTLGALIFTPAFTALIAGMLLLNYNVVMGGEGTFRQLFSAATHAQFVNMAGAYVILGLAFLGSDQLVLSPALLLPDLGAGFLGRFVGSINVFAVWTCVVLGIAVHRIYPKRSVAGAAVYLLVLYLVLVGLGAAFAGALMGLAASGAG